ncbi:hypothetical protein A0H81_00362 [Grifola frondosa]|uniref:Uncharacterized protein n=1 Tax=Grifola frondosa TaxID=5627 RepID=A0A1C7MPM8_GRIFR|nr:hypothetical protein A0H81_00362 [Grifola frondosa]
MGSCLFMYQLQTWYGEDINMSICLPDTQSMSGWASIAIVQLIIQLWLYTIYNWNRRFVAFISTIYVVFVISTAITYGITMSRLRVLTTTPFCIVVDMSVGDSFIATAIVELATATLPPYLLATTLPWLGFTLLMLSLLAYRTIKSYRTRQSHDLAFILIRDTMVYCVVIFVVDLLDVLVVTLASSTLVPASSGLVIALPSILGSRMLLNLRQVDRKRELRLAVDGIDVDQWETILDI